MKAYKFQSVDNLHFVVDILFNKRLYCCRADQLNDIREGDLRVGNDRGRELQIIEYGDAVARQLKELRVCALTKSFDNHLLWTHYANGYSGVVIEVEVDKADVTAVTYGLSGRSGGTGNVLPSWTSVAGTSTRAPSSSSISSMERVSSASS